MALAPENFQVENIHSSILDLQDEKGSLEEKLIEARNRRRALEKKCENVSMKHKQLSDKRCKMQETVKIAHHKVNQSQSQIDSQQELNEGKQSRMNCLNDLIRDQQQLQEQELNELQEKLTELTGQFHHARQFYTDQNLKSEISLMEKKKTEIADQAARIKTEVEELETRVDCMKLQMNTTEDLLTKEEFSPELQMNVLKLFEEDRHSAARAVECLRRKESDLQEELKRLTTQLRSTDVRMEE